MVPEQGRLKKRKRWETEGPGMPGKALTEALTNRSYGPGGGPSTGVGSLGHFTVYCRLVR